MAEDASTDQAIADLRSALAGKASSADVGKLVDQRLGALEARLLTRMDQQMEAKFSTLTIQSGPNIQVSGSGRNMTIAWVAPPPPNWTGVGVCGGDGTIQITLSSN